MSRRVSSIAPWAAENSHAFALAILGLDPLHRDWLDAVAALRASQEIELVAAGHRSFAAARDAADALRSPEFPAPPVYDDLRLLLTEAAPRLILMDRPANVSIEFLLACVAQEITVLSLGPPVESLGEAQALSRGAPAAHAPSIHMAAVFRCPGLAALRPGR